MISLLQIRKAVEQEFVDDTTHNMKKRKERDIFLNELFEELNIKLLRIKVSNNYEKDIKLIKQTIIEVMADSEY